MTIYKVTRTHGITSYGVVWLETRGTAERFRDRWLRVNPEHKSEIVELELTPTRRGVAAFLNQHAAL